MKQFLLAVNCIIFLPEMSQNFSCHSYRNTTNLERILSYSFDGFSCVQLFSGTNELPREWHYYYLKVIKKIGIPVIINGSQQYCHGSFIFTKDVIQLRKILFSLRKHYTDRIVCYLYDEDETFTQMIKNESFIFGESEALVSDNYHTYKLNSIERKFYPINIVEETQKWEKCREIMNFKGRMITVASFNISLFTAIGPIDDKGNPAWTGGLDFDTFSLLSSLMNITWRVTVPTEENKWGYKMANGSWSGGVYKALMDGRADVGLSCVWLTFEKYQSFSLSVARDMVSIRHLVRRPRLNLSWLSPFKSFALSVWGPLSATVLISTIAVSLLTHWKNKIDNDFKYKSWRSFWASGYLVFGVLVMCSVPPSNKRQGPLRHLLSSWVVTCFFLTSCFGSGLVSHLTSPDLHGNPQTIKELVEGGYFWGMTSELKPDLSLVLDLSNPWHKKWAERFMLVTSKEEHVNLLDEDKFVLWGKSVEDVGYYLNENYLPPEKLSKWETSSELITNFYFTFALTPGSQLQPAIDKYTTQIIETGHAQHFLRMTFDRNGETYMKEVMVKTKGNFVASALTKYHFGGLFFILLVGLAIASISFSAEIVHSKIIMNVQNENFKK